MKQWSTKQFNEEEEYEHFTMENFHSATNLMRQNCYVASVDLRRTYYFVSTHPGFRKFLKLKWRGQLYAYTCFPNGLANCPLYFTKLLKPVYTHLKAQGFLSAAFIDDCYLQDQTYEECKQILEATVQVFQRLGFVIHRDKSVLEPTREIILLGFHTEFRRHDCHLVRGETEQS